MRRFLAMQFAGLVLLCATVFAVDVLSTHLERQRILAPQREIVARMKEAGENPCADPRFVCGTETPPNLRLPGSYDPPIAWREGAAILQTISDVALQRRRVLLAVVVFVWLGLFVLPEFYRQIRLRRVVAGVLDPDASPPSDALQSAFSGTVRELVAARRRLVSAERLETMGLFAGGIAHQIGNPLAALRQYVDLLRADLDAGAVPDAQVVGRIGELSERMDRAVAALARLARPDRIERSPVVLAGLCDRVAQMAARGASVEWTIDIPAGAMVLADEIMLEQALYNLVRNAIEAQDAPQVSLAAHRVPEGWLLVVQDHGPGFPDEFDPQAAFATGKMHGTGLGLPLALRLLELIGAQTVFDNTAVGARITIRLAAVDRATTVH